MINLPAPHRPTRSDSADVESSSKNATGITFDRGSGLLPARMINEFAYCPRLFYYEHIEGLFVNNADTVEGTIQHKNVDAKTSALPTSKKGAASRPKSPAAKANRASKASAAANTNNADDEQPERIHATSVMLSSEQYSIISKIDLIEVNGNAASPVEYKRGKPKTNRDGSLTAWDPERVQLCVQALILREHGYDVQTGTIFFWKTRQRVVIPIDDELVALTVGMIEKSRQLMATPKIPPPLDCSPKCPRCSLVSLCLPDETNTCRQVLASEDSREQSHLFDFGPSGIFGDEDSLDLATTTKEAKPPTAIRQLITARDHRRPLYLNTPGMTVGKSGELLKVKEKGKVVHTARLRETSQVNLMGAIQVSTQAIQELMKLEIPLLYFSGGGWFYGMTQPLGLKNIMWRIEQFRAADSPKFCLSLARQLVDAKIRNQRTLLMRNHISPPVDAVRFMKALLLDVKRASSLSQLLGTEGMAAKVYFQHFAGMIKVNSDAEVEARRALCSDPADEPDEDTCWLKFDFKGRNRRPPRDPVNALLSLGYSLLAKDLTIACAGIGLDPYLGFYHQPRYGRASLALDLMEPFRPLIVDSAVLSAINTRMVTPGDFISAGDAVALKVSGRKGFIRAYEQRMDQLVMHPLFGYRVSYRRMLEIQARLLARVLVGEIREYPSFTTR